MSAIATIIRSKNSGPFEFELSFDIIFDDKVAYERVKSTDILSDAVICRLYHVEAKGILSNMFFDPAMA